jgi:hypothetical protein
MANRIQLRRDTAANWTRENPILSQGEPGFDLTANKLKVGDGVTAWAELDYASGAGANFDYSTLQEGLFVPFGGVTSITGNHDTNTGVGLTSESWAQLMWVPDTSVVTVDEISDGANVYNWAYVDDQGFHITNHVNTATHQWQFNTSGHLTLPDGGVIKNYDGSNYGGGGVSISDFGEGFSLTSSTNKIVTNKLYSTNATQPNQHYRLELDTNGVVVLPDQSIINGSTLRGVYGTGELNYTGITIGPDANHREESWMYVDHNGAWIATDYSDSARTWHFDNNGVLTLPLGSTITDTASAPGNGNGQAVEIKPGGASTATQLLKIYPTVPSPDGNHIHITSGDLLVTDLFLGNDYQFVQIAVDGKVCIGTYGTEGHFWQFGTDGVLTLPDGGVIKNYDGSNYGGGGFVTTSTLVNSTSTVSLGSDGKLSLPGDLELLDAKNIIKSGGRTALFKKSGTLLSMVPNGGGLLAVANFTIRTVNNTSTYTLTFASSTPTAYSWSGFGMDMTTGTPINIWGAKFTATADQDYTIATFETVGDTFQVILTDYTTGYLYRITSVLTTTSSSSITIEQIA